MRAYWKLCYNKKIRQNYCQNKNEKPISRHYCGCAMWLERQQLPGLIPSNAKHPLIIFRCSLNLLGLKVLEVVNLNLPGLVLAITMGCRDLKNISLPFRWCLDCEGGDRRWHLSAIQSVSCSEAQQTCSRHAVIKQ